MKQVKTVADTLAYKISTRLLMQVALRRGYYLTYFPSAPSTKSGITRAEKGGKVVFFKSTCTSLTPSFGVHAAENKYLTHSMLTAYGVNTPDIVALTPEEDPSTAAAMLQSHSHLVVKPAQMNHGDGVTVNVTEEGLREAILFARKANGGKDILVQQQVEGKEYRFLVVSGKVIAVAHRRPPCVIGDGQSTILELLEDKNRDPRRGTGHANELTTISLDDVRQHRGDEFLERVLSKGEEVNVLDTSNLSRGGESIDFTEEASPTLRKMAVAAAKSCFLGIAGVDIITSDISTDSLEHSYVIEVNLTPGIRMHQFPSHGTPRDVATTIFNEIEKTVRPVKGSIKYLGRAEKVAFPEREFDRVPARIDTGAKTSSIWASQVSEKDGSLHVVFFGADSPFYTGETVTFEEYDKIAVANSTGNVQIRYKVKLLVKIKGKKIRGWFTLADRSMQVYPVLIGRNVLMGKFLVDVTTGRILKQAELKRSAALQKLVKETEE